MPGGFLDDWTIARQGSVSAHVEALDKRELKFSIASKKQKQGWKNKNLTLTCRLLFHSRMSSVLGYSEVYYELDRRIAMRRDR